MFSWLFTRSEEERRGTPSYYVCPSSTPTSVEITELDFATGSRKNYTSEPISSVAKTRNATPPTQAGPSVVSPQTIITTTTTQGKEEVEKKEEEKMDQFDAALDLLRRLDPKHTATHLNNLTKLCPSLTEDLLTSVDQPLTIRRCKTGRDYLICDYNRDGDSYRSPWSNEFDPPLEVESELGEGSMPNERVRKMEIQANEAFDVYREMYYEGGVSSVYFWNLDDGFAGVVLIKKGASKGINSSGVWDSIHVFEAVDRARTCHYKLTSTVILHLSTKSDALGEMDLSGNMTRQIEQDMPVESDTSHVANIGRMVEDMELKMRNLLQEVYFGKAKDVVGDLRSLQNLSGVNKEKAQHQEMIDAMKK